MTDETRILFNGSCPICSREVAGYARYSAANALPLRFVDLAGDETSAFGVTQDQAARRLHVLKDGKLLAGVPAFIALWSEMPRFAWLARLVALPVMRPLAEVVYERILAPALYALHRRRQRRAGHA